MVVGMTKRYGWACRRGWTNVAVVFRGPRGEGFGDVVVLRGCRYGQRQQQAAEYVPDAVILS